jgi:glycosyltransferase involved in cell wall biosynthesis
MKIAIDSGPLSSGHSLRGIGVYTRELLKALDMQGVDVSSTDLSKYDVVHFTSFKPFVVSIPFIKPKSTKFVLTIYDLIPLIYPKHYPSGIRGLINWHINKYLIKKNVDAIITISETSKKDICRFLEINPDKVFVTYLAPRNVFKKLEIGDWKLEIAKQYGLPKKFVLYVGDINYNKNIPWLIEKANKMKLPLVIVGKQAKEIEKMNLNHPELKHLKNIDWKKIIRLGFVDDSDLVRIYNLATVYIQPSLYEGFGLPALEAVACGTPIIFYKSQALVEILEDGKKLPRDYSWEKTAKETMEVYRNV